MRLFFLIYHYFPFGGQQRDFFRIAEACLSRGYEIEVYALRWQGPKPAPFNVKLVPVKAFSRLSMYRRYTDWVSKRIDDSQPDLVIGFNKMPHLDMYFAADDCFLYKAATQRGPLYPFTPRYRHFQRYEAAVFGRESLTRALVLSPLQRKNYLQYYPDCAPRLRDIPPGIDQDRRIEHRDPRNRSALREELEVTENQLLILQVGSGFKIKGVDRAMRAIAALPEELRDRVRYVLIGQDKAGPYRRLAKKLGLTNQVEILPGRDDIPRFLVGADLLLHPAYMESAGYVLLEATVSGLPVLTTASCGYAFHVERAQSGEVCSDPFRQDELNARLEVMLLKLDSAPWSQNGLIYGKQPELYSLPSVAARCIEVLFNSRKSEARV
ncbi:MAG: glucosyltransferase I RfaG [Gammaproteobacteria bacterium]|nr:glucosyltransferase I RfaG [Gammaproteobacteria bacterium]